MTRENRIAAAVQAVDDFQNQTAAEIAAAIGQATPRANPHPWTRDELVARFGELLVATATAQLGPFFATYLVSGIDMAAPGRRARFEPGGDLREVIGAELSERLLALGVIESTPWTEAGNQDEPPSAEEVDQALATIVNQSLNRQRLAANYNAAAALVESDPTATWEQVAELLGG